MSVPPDDLVPCFTKPLTKTQLAYLFKQGADASVISPLRVAEKLNALGVFHVFIGGVIVGCWTGVPRATEDVDLVLGRDAPVKKVAKLIKGLRKDLQITTYPSVIRCSGRTPLGRKNLIDLVRPYDGVYSHTEEYFVDLVVQGIPVRIPTPEMLVVMKYAASTSLTRAPDKQYVDIGDLRALVHAQPNLDLTIVRKLANYIGPTLGAKLIRKIKAIRA